MTNAFTNAVINDQNEKAARTTNGMKARETTANKCVDLFHNIGASRGKNIIPAFVAAFVEDKELATRIALWARDVRGGAGERQVFKDILKYIDENDPELLTRIAHKVPELGRWDDLFAITRNRNIAFELIKDALEDNNGLAAKWMPRKGEDAVALRNFLGYSPKRYRKTLVGLTNVVETAMCSKDWSAIKYSHVPSVAAARYQKAFTKNDPTRYAEYRAGLIKGTEKINASTLYPYDVLKSIRYGGDAQVALAQWDALPNYVGDANAIAVVDVSGSMTCPAGGYGSKSNVSCLDVALSLGLYIADKNTGAFKDTFLTFSDNSKLMHLKGDLLAKLHQMERSQWEMSTNLHAAFEEILRVATQNNVPQTDMPKTILILSDMQFNYCVRHDDSALQMIRRKYENAGYNVPQVVFWNLNASYGNQPARYDDSGVALVSGFSPALMTSIIGGADFTPYGIMMETVSKEKYNF